MAGRGRAPRRTNSRALGAGLPSGPPPLSWCAWPAPASGRAQSLGSDGRARTRWRYLLREPRGPYLLW